MAKIASERVLLQQMAKNRATAAGKSPAAVEARQAAPAVDTAVKQPKQDLGAPWIKNPKGQ
jgi:hypothetical protein